MVRDLNAGNCTEGYDPKDGFRIWGFRIGGLGFRIWGFGIGV